MAGWGEAGQGMGSSMNPTLRRWLRLACAWSKQSRARVRRSEAQLTRKRKVKEKQNGE
jgi:hypothetical protein